jgi:starch phosphorylase
MQQAENELSPYALTLCFARRFATYKRGTLLLRDPERLLRMIRDEKHPVQLIFAGKAHPQDMPGKELIKEIVHFAEKYNVENRIVFVENYDMTVARYLTSGADVWLNTPRRPMEASGTSGMKAAINGVLNCSILDGWWDEAYNSGVGWAIGNGEQYHDDNMQDEIESKALYDILEREIIPMYYNRGRDGLPHEGIGKMKNSMREIGQSMSCHRMLMDYSNKFYLPALKNYREIIKGDYADSRSLAAYAEKLTRAWPSLKITAQECNAKPVMQRGDNLTVKAYIELGELSPAEALVELYMGSVNSQKEIVNSRRHEMKAIKKEGDAWLYQAKVDCADTGMQGHTIRILPKHPQLIHPYRCGFIKWA